MVKERRKKVKNTLENGRNKRKRSIDEKRNIIIIPDAETTKNVPNAEIVAQDKNESCSNEMDMGIISKVIGESIKNCFVHPVKFEMVFKEWNINMSDVTHMIKQENIGKYMSEDESIRKRSIIESLNWNSLVFSHYITTIKVISRKNGNKDNRGGGCGNLELPVEDFEYTIVNKDGITLRNVTEAVYRVKGSKYDWWNELYCGINIMSKTLDTIVIEVKFDYGS